MTLTVSWEDIRQQLEARLGEINEEIGAYPAPITGCDAQFNHLLEQRAALNAELTRLDAAMSGDAGALETFVESCPLLAGPGGEKQ